MRVFAPAVRSHWRFRSLYGNEAYGPISTSRLSIGRPITDQPPTTLTRPGTKGPASPGHAPPPGVAARAGSERRAHSASSARIASRLRRAILEGEYGYGERLPPERELSARFGAARGTVRAALDRLAALDFIVRRVGSGTFVRYRGHADQEDVAVLTSPLELIDVRMAIEPPMVRLAVLHANAQDLGRMAEALARVEAGELDARTFSHCDEAFHLSIAASTHNPLLMWLYRQLNDVRAHAQWSARRDTVLSAERMTHYNRQHRELYSRIASRDVEGAVRVISGHLEQARSDLMGA